MRKKNPPPPDTECLARERMLARHLENHSEFKPTTQNHRFVQETHPGGMTNNKNESCIINLRRGLFAGGGGVCVSFVSPLGTGAVTSRHWPVGFGILPGGAESSAKDYLE